jgi:hypothetical protein
MSFYAVSNLTEQSMSACEPWTFTSELPSAKVCLDKEERENWYRTKSTVWNFYTGIESANPNQRCSKDNPPKYIHAFVADYDIKIPEERINEAIQSMPIKPAWVERSLGGNCRLLWTFPRPVTVESFDFAVWVLQRAEGWLSLDLLPGLDAPAFENPTRLLCNGANWRSTGHGPINENKLQAFFVECAKKFKFKAPDGNEIPLDVVEKSLREKYPGFNWPSAFDLDTQGPSFWIAGSTSPLSAIVKKEGMLTFSAHASKPFYSWADILGPDFVKEFNEGSIAKATLNVYHDGHLYWRIIDGVYQSVSDSAMKVYIKKGCGIPEKKVDDALFHLHENCRVAGAAPFIFRTPGLIEFNCRKILNTWKNSVMQPSDEVVNPESLWIFHFLNQLFDPPEQLYFFLAWLKHYYTAAYELKPRPGQNCFFMGEANRGKTFCCRELVGKIVGGFVDASDYIVRGDSFGSENFHVPLWCIDDSTPGNSLNSQDRFAAMMKKAAANQQFRFNEKYKVPCTIEWMGRITVTANLDHSSSRILGSMDNTSAEKTNVFRCTDTPIQFPERYELQKILSVELPKLCRFLLTWEVPDHILRHGRYGYEHYHEQTLVEKTHQTSRAAPFRELLIEELKAFFTQNPGVNEWRGTLVELIRLLHSNPHNDYVMKSLKLESMNRYLEIVEREGTFKCTAETGDLKTRVWIFYRQ